MRNKFMLLVLMIVILLLSALSGCKEKKVEESYGKPLERKAEEPVNLLEDNKENIIKDFRNMVKSDNDPFILVNFIDENIDKVAPEYKEEMIMELELVQEKYIERYTDQLFGEDHQMELLSLSSTGESEIQLFFDENKVEDIKNGNLRELVDKILLGKYKLINMEGSFYPIIDYEKLKIYNKYLSPEMKDYLEIKSMDSNMPTILDAGLMISFEKLSDRLIKAENHITKYPEGIRYEELLRLYGTYLKLYLEGLDNTPIYDYETKKIREEVLSSYKKTANIKDTVTSKIINKYIDIIKENENTIDVNVLSKITELYNEAIATLEVRQ